MNKYIESKSELILVRGRVNYGLVDKDKKCSNLWRVLCPVCIHTIVSIALLGTQGVGETYSMARLLQPPQMFSDQYKSYESGRNVLTKLSLNSSYIYVYLPNA